MMDFVLGDFPMYNNTSTLRLIRVTGAIGGKVYCTTTYKGDTRSARPATLSVIGKECVCMHVGVGSRGRKGGGGRPLNFCFKKFGKH